MSKTTIPLDAVDHSWVARTPAPVQPYLRLMRLDRPIGTWLLFWPCVFGLALGAALEHRDFLLHANDWWLLALFGLGSVVMRGAGCTYNDIVDRKIDAQVERTRGRPIPSGAVSVAEAVAFLAAQCFVGLLILLLLNPFAMMVGALSLVLVAGYPFMKRITWWPQAWLGLTFNWGALLGCAAMADRLPLAAYVLYASGLFWTLGYDTIYALQDIEDDALVGVKSTARLFGTAEARKWIAAFFAVTLVLFAAAALMAHLGLPVQLALLVAGAHLVWQVRTLRPADPKNCLRLFRANRDTGLLLALALIVAGWAL